MRMIAATICVLAMVASANALTVNYGWEDGGTVLGTYGNVGSATNVSTPVHSGLASLELVENPIGSTPQAFVAYIENLSEGDVVDASFWVYDTTPDTNPSGRIWGHWANNGDVTSYTGSASGNYDYSAGDGWTQLSFSWTVPADQEALVVEARIYSGDETTNTIWVDDLCVIAPNTAAVSVPVPEPATMALLGLGGLFLRRRRA